MIPVLTDAIRPQGKTTLTIHTGTPTADTTFNFPNITMVRVWEDGTLAEFDQSGAAVAFLRPGSYWGYIWQ